MKKILFLSALAIGISAASFAQGHHQVDTHNQGYANNQYSNNQYYYYPEANVYYNPAASTYYYNDGGSWRTNRNLPQHIVVDNSRRVPLDYNGSAVWENNSHHRQQYGAYNNGNVVYNNPSAVYNKGYGTYNQNGGIAPDGHPETVKYRRNKTIIKH